MSKIKNDAAKTTTKVCHNLAQVAVKMIMGCFGGEKIAVHWQVHMWRVCEGCLS